jgi:hypothetical protein
MGTPPVPAQPKKSNVGWWILGVLLGGVALLTLGGVFLATYFARQMDVKVSSSGESVEVSTPVGSIRASKDASADPGLPLYPGAKITEGAGSVEVATDEEGVEIIAARYRTIDPMPKVDEWYRGQLGPDFKREGPGVYQRKKEILGIRVSSEDVAFISETDDVIRVVALQRKFNGVDIGLVRIAKKEAQ